MLQGHWIRLGGLGRAGRYVRDPAVILIERAHQSPKCNTHGPISRATPSYLPRHALSAHFVLTSVKRDTGPTAHAAASFFLYYPPQFGLARIISYASLNKSARTAITIDTACLPPLSSRWPFHLFRPARGPNTHTHTHIRTHTRTHHDSARDRFVKYEDFNQKDDGIRARISDENYRDADIEELMIDATGEGSTILENELAAIFCVLLCNERTYKCTAFQVCQCPTAIPSVCATRLATKIDKRALKRPSKKEYTREKNSFSLLSLNMFRISF